MALKRDVLGSKIHSPVSNFQLPQPIHQHLFYFFNVEYEPLNDKVYFQVSFYKRILLGCFCLNI